jgi:hypothetical protein
MIKYLERFCRNPERKNGVMISYIRAIKYMYSVKMQDMAIDDFHIIGLHQGSTLSPCFFYFSFGGTYETHSRFSANMYTFYRRSFPVPQFHYSPCSIKYPKQALLVQNDQITLKLQT